MAMLPLEPTLRVGELYESVEAALAEAFPDEVWIEGEIRSRRDVPTSRGSGRHVYFDLVEPGADGAPPVALLPVKLFETNRRRVNAELTRHGSIKMTEGVRVRIRGRVGVYAAWGRIDFTMTGIDPGFTLAQLATERERVLAALAAEGLLERNAALPFPSVPLRIGLVTSGGSAAHADFVDELAGSGLTWQVLLVDVRVQGPTAAGGIAAGVRDLGGHGVDVIAVVRGGGARTDLAAFDTEVVARAIAGATVPVITGIGHEIDTTAADAVAHRAHKTPTACAAALVGLARDRHDRAEELWADVVGHAERLLRDEARSTDHRATVVTSRARLGLERATAGLDGAGVRVAGCVDRRLLLGRADLTRAAHRLEGILPRLLEADRRLVERGHRTALASRRAVEVADATLDRLALRRDALDPDRLLRRGWSVTRGPDGRVIRTVGEAPAGTELRTRVADGTLVTTVSDVEPDGDRTEQSP